MVWGTRVENMDDARRHGRIRLGERHQNSKLTDDAVREMRKLRAMGETFRALADLFGVSASNACAACSGKQWGHVPL